MRLIDADALVKEIEKIALEAEQQVHGRRSGKTLAKGILFGLGVARKIILDQPTAYDPDKVVQKLEENCNNSEKYCLENRENCNLYSHCDQCAFKSAISIVKGGGVDGN